MRRLVLLLLALAAPASARVFPSGQNLASEMNRLPVTDADALRYLAAAGITSPTRRWQIDQTYHCLKTAGVYPKLGEAFLFAAPTSSAALVDMIDPTHTATAVNSPTFTAWIGFTGDQVASYVDWNDVFGSARSKCLQNSCTLGGWGSAAGGPYFVGSTTNGNAYIRGNSLATISRLFSTNTVSTATGLSGVLPWVHAAVTRNSSASVRNYWNSYISYGSGDQAATSTAVATEITSLRSNAGYSAGPIRLAYVGQGMTDADIAAIHQCFAPLMAVGQ